MEKLLPETSQASVMPARSAIFFPISFSVTFSQVLVLSVLLNPLFAGVDTAERVPDTGHPENFGSSRMNFPQSSVMSCAPSCSQSERTMVAETTLPSPGYQSVIHLFPPPDTAMSKLSAWPLAGSVYVTLVTVLRCSLSMAFPSTKILTVAVLALMMSSRSVPS